MAKKKKRMKKKTKKKTSKKRKVKRAESKSVSVKKGAAITKVELHNVLDFWRKKPRQLRFDDTDVVVVTVKAGESIIKETFFTCVKPDGTFNVNTANRSSRARRQKLANFLDYYLNVKNPKEYNLKKNMKSWKGTKVKIENGLIYLP